MTVITINKIHIVAYSHYIYYSIYTYLYNILLTIFIKQFSQDIETQLMRLYHCAGDHYNNGGHVNHTTSLLQMIQEFLDINIVI